LERARIPMQIDIGFGDTITPRQLRLRFQRSSMVRHRCCWLIPRRP
jgi:hypothetical protein